VRALPGILRAYLHHLLRSSALIGEMRMRSKGIRPNHERLYWEDFAEICVRLPDIGMQRRIADFLDDQVARIDNIASTRSKQGDLISEHLQSMVQAEIAATCEPLRNYPFRILASRDGAGVVTGSRGARSVDWSQRPVVNVDLERRPMLDAVESLRSPFAGWQAGCQPFDRSVGRRALVLLPCRLRRSSSWITTGGTTTRTSMLLSTRDAQSTATIGSSLSRNMFVSGMISGAAAGSAVGDYPGRASSPAWWRSCAVGWGRLADRDPRVRLMPMWRRGFRRCADLVRGDGKEWDYC